jgi:competence protein ComEC
VLFCGDLEEDGIAGLLAWNADRVKADVVMLPHHGTPTPGLRELLAAASPQLVVSSNARLSDSRREALARQLGGIPWLDTDRCGAIHIHLTRGKVQAAGFVSEE